VTDGKVSAASGAVMSDRPSPSPLPDTASSDDDAAATTPMSRQMDQKTVTKRAEDEADMLGVFA